MRKSRNLLSFSLYESYRTLIRARVLLDAGTIVDILPAGNNQCRCDFNQTQRSIERDPDEVLLNSRATLCVGAALARSAHKVDYGRKVRDPCGLRTSPVIRGQMHVEVWLEIDRSGFFIHRNRQFCIGDRGGKMPVCGSRQRTSRLARSNRQQ